MTSNACYLRWLSAPVGDTGTNAQLPDATVREREDHSGTRLRGNHPAVTARKAVFLGITENARRPRSAKLLDEITSVDLVQVERSHFIALQLGHGNVERRRLGCAALVGVAAGGYKTDGGKSAKSP
ncbi:hypothetical protein D1610_11470 [Sphingomonas gilva]|uniref:Uncharacterized protein n=1 Tax=Sphingomonas gilva TaxID=2305907 RepID=A0A396RU08_9SPHN|nr:hypothetical protein [Sphingomonas gilva]RHW17161.1 hypothetical protein D1610_11470 [Sphingomonas gilva]